MRSREGGKEDLEVEDADGGKPDGGRRWDGGQRGHLARDQLVYIEPRECAATCSRGPAKILCYAEQELGDMGSRQVGGWAGREVSRPAGRKVNRYALKAQVKYRVVLSKRDVTQDAAGGHEIMQENTDFEGDIVAQVKYCHTGARSRTKMEVDERGKEVNR